MQGEVEEETTHALETLFEKVQLCQFSMHVQELTCDQGPDAQYAIAVLIRV